MNDNSHTHSEAIFDARRQMIDVANEDVRQLERQLAEANQAPEPHRTFARKFAAEKLRLARIARDAIETGIGTEG